MNTLSRILNSLVEGEKVEVSTMQFTPSSGSAEDWTVIKFTKSKIYYAIYRGTALVTLEFTAYGGGAVGIGKSQWYINLPQELNSTNIIEVNANIIPSAEYTQFLTVERVTATQVTLRASRLGFSYSTSNNKFTLGVWGEYS